MLSVQDHHILSHIWYQHLSLSLLCVCVCVCVCVLSSLSPFQKYDYECCLQPRTSTFFQWVSHPFFRPRTSFIEGEAGIFALAAVLNALKQPEMQRYLSVPFITSNFCECKAINSWARNEWVEQLLGLQKFVLEKHNTENEVLYGRAGYLYALLFVGTLQEQRFSYLRTGVRSTCSSASGT